jgi:TPR repeat protein
MGGMVMSNSYYIGNIKVSQDTLNKINKLMASNQKLEAIKYVREISGLGLADAKKWVENYQSYDLSEEQPFDSQIPTQVSSGTNNTSTENSDNNKKKKTPAEQKKKAPKKSKKLSTFDVLFPTTYGNTRFISMDDVKSQTDSNPDALGFFSQCSIFGAGTSKKGNNALEGLFSAANAKCSDAILFLGRMYEYGMTFIRQDVKQALNLYKYAYSLENIDALHSLGYILYNSFDKKSIGLSMMKKSAELGSRGAKFHLNLLDSQIADIEICRFEEILESEFAFSEHEALRSISLYDVDLTNPTAIKSALLNIMNNMKPQTFSVIMNEFRMKHLRGRELFHFEDVDFRCIFDSLVSDGVIEAGGVGDFGVTENTLYISRESTQKMKTTILDGDDWDI